MKSLRFLVTAVFLGGYLCVILAPPLSATEPPSPLGDQFQVNSYTTSSQLYTSVASDSEGDFVVVWMSYQSGGSDSSDTSIQLRRFAADATPLDSDFQANSYTTDGQWDPSIAVDAMGKFVVTWTGDASAGTDNSQGSIQVRRFMSDGTPAGEDQQVNTYTTSYQHSPSIAASPDGDFVVVWFSNGSSGTDNGWSVQGQKFAADGTPEGSEFQVNSYTTNGQGSPDVAMAADGEFVVVWDSLGSYDSDTDGWSIQGQRFAADGTPQGSQFQINTYSTSHQVSPAVALGSEGNLVVVWRSSGQDGDGWGIFGQLVDSTGTLQGNEFQVNSYWTGSQGYGGPRLTVAPSGEFVVVWASVGSYGTDNSSYSVQGQWFAADATPLGGQFQVNSYTTSYQGYYGTDVAMTTDGEFVVVWNSYGSYGSDSSSGSIQGQRFATSIFTDGFESGDTSAWSSTVP